MEKQKDPRFWYELRIDYPNPIDECFTVVVQMTEEELNDICQMQNYIDRIDGKHYYVDNFVIWTKEEYMKLLYRICEIASERSYIRTVNPNKIETEDGCVYATIENVIMALRRVVAEQLNLAASARFQIERRIELLSNYTKLTANEIKGLLQDLFFDTNCFCYWVEDEGGYEDIPPGVDYVIE